MSDVAAINQFVTKYKTLKTEIAKVIVGQDEVVNQILISILKQVEFTLFPYTAIATM